MLEQAINDYHALLTPEMAHQTQAQLTEEQRALNLYFGERPLVSVLRPRLVTAAQYALLREACSGVGEAMRRLSTAMLDDAALRRSVGLTPVEERLIAMHPGYAEPSAHSRMDTFLTIDGQSLQFVEYNAESPAAIAYEDSLSALFLRLPVMQEFAKSYTLTDLPARHLLLDTLQKTWAEFGGTGAPNVAILDWRGLPTHSEFLLWQAYFAEHGIEAAICAPDDLRYHDGKLYARNVETLGTLPPVEFPVDIVFKRVLTSEFVTHYGDDVFEHPLVQAYADGKVCVINSFRAKLLHKKAIFALLTDDSLQPLFSAEQRAAIARHVPWTRTVVDGTSTYQGDEIDLLDFARKNQARLLLKPNDEYGGKGIVIGWECDAATWEAGLKEAMGSPFVVQERVTIAYEDFPAMANGQLHIGQRLVDSDPFMFGTHCEGSLVRLSTVTLLNVTAGGGSTVPMFVVDQR